MSLLEKYTWLRDMSVDVSRTFDFKTSYGTAGTYDYILVPVSKRKVALTYLQKHYKAFKFSDGGSTDNETISIIVKEVR